MSEPLDGVSEIRRIAFLGDYLPRQCGIATFTSDLLTAVAAEYPRCECFAVPVNDIQGGYDYAFWWIKQSVERAIADKSRTIRIPVHAGERLRKVRFAARDLGQRLGRKATPHEIATRLGLPVGALDRAFADLREPLPLESGDRDGFDLTKTLPDTQAPCPFHQVSQREIRQRLGSVLRELDSREQTILRMRFGIGPAAARTLEQIGRRLSLSRERVRQIECVALKKIRTSPGCRGLAELFFGQAGSRTP